MSFGPAVRNGLGIGLGPTATLSTAFSQATLDFDFIDNLVFPTDITFTRASSATMFDSSGTLVYAPMNLCLQSQDISTTWTNSNSTEQIDIAVAPNGTTTADAIVDTVDAVNTTHAISQTLTFVANTSYVFSMYAKADTLPGIQILLPSAAFGVDQRASYDCTTGTVLNVAGTATLSIIPVGSGWYRCVMQATATALSAGSIQIRLIKNVSGSLTSFYVGDGTGKALVWGAQLNLANMQGGVTASLSTYYPTTTAAYQGPRLDYNPATLAARGLLIEEQRTNSIRNNTMQGAVAGTPGTAPTNWSIQTSASGLTRTIVGTGTENGITYIDIRYAGTTSAAVSGAIICSPEATTQVAAASGQSWTGAFYIKLTAGSFAGLSSLNTQITERDAAGALLIGTSSPILSSVTSADLATQRYSVTRTLNNAATAFVTSELRFSVPISTAIDFTLRIGLPQLEQGAFATSVIPTTTAAATRSADVASVNTLSPWYNAAEGTLYVDFAGRQAGIQPYLTMLSNTGETERIYQRYVSAQYQTIARVAGVDITSVYNSAESSAVNAKIASAYNASQLATSTNGQAVTGFAVASLSSVPSGLNRLWLGSFAGTGAFANGYLRRITYYPSRLSNAQLQALTA